MVQIRQERPIWLGDLGTLDLGCRDMIISQPLKISNVDLLSYSFCSILVWGRRDLISAIEQDPTAMIKS